MQVNPKITFWVGIWTSLLLTVGTGTLSLTHLIPDAWIPIVTAWCMFLGTINSYVLTALSGYSSSAKGPLVAAPTLPPIAKVVIAFFVVMLALSFALPAMAQPRLKLPIPLPQPKPLAAMAAPADPLGDFMNQLENVKADTISAVVTDIQAADADAGTIVIPANPTATPPLDAQVRDPIAHACYPALIKFLQSTPTFQPATGKLVGFQLFQRKRDFIAQLQAGLPTYLKLGCAPLLGDEVNTLIQSLAMIGVKLAPAGIAAICPPCAAAVAPIALPALTLTP